MKLKYLTTQQELAALKYENVEPFLLAIDEAEFLVQQIVRVVPGKRLVLKGIWKQQRVVVKVFCDKQQARQHFDRELKGFRCLRENEFNIPSLLFAGSLGAEPVYVIVFVELYPVKKVARIFSVADENEIKYWLMKIQEVVIRLHDKGLLQADLHADNFLLVSDDIYLVDFSGILQKADKVEQFHNLALFYAQLPIRLHALVPILLVDYCQQRHWQESVQQETQLLHLVAELRYRRGVQWQEKCLRCCSAVVATLSLTKAYSFLRHHHSNDLMAFILSPAAYLQTNECEIIKAGNACTLFKIKIANQFYMVKRYNVKSAFHFITHCWQRSRAMKSWLNANLLELFGVPTAAPVAFVEERALGFRKTSYFIMEYLGKEILSDQFFTEIDERLVTQTARVIADLATLHISHGDMKKNNFMVKEDKVYIVDLDAMQYHQQRNQWRAAFKKDIKRFRLNWRNSPELLKAFDLALSREVEW